LQAQNYLVYKLLKNKDIKNWLKEQVLLYSPFQNFKNSQLGTNVTCPDVYSQ